MNETNLEEMVESQKQAKRMAIFGVVLSMLALLFIVFAIGFMVSGLKKTVEELSVELDVNKAEAVLASSSLPENTNVSVPVLYYDQEMDECVDLYDTEMKDVLAARQFEWNECGYYGEDFEEGLVDGKLSAQFLPVATGSGTLKANRGINSSSFARWFSAVEGVSKVYAKTLNLSYNADEYVYKFESNEFYPLNDVSFEKTGVNADGRNHLFTMNLGVPIKVLSSGEEEFEIVADDDTWVFLNDKIVLDLGGVHSAKRARFKINAEGEVYSALENEEFVYAGVNVSKDAVAVVRVFHADRNSDSSVFKIYFKRMILNINDTVVAANDNGVEVAYDPADPGHVQPLGESVTTKGNNSRGLAFALTAQVLMLGVLAVSFTIIISRILKKIG